ncbi:unnamed protein product [Paramecium sonneborni]|uniref:Uncharacterized protein n=1 Tax=Paramecium sonneborni TaxID=65129 RepID=A0A8S1N5R5_9CILI|nr:unnamed protein product [Paramecium sonneborni]
MEEYLDIRTNSKKNLRNWIWNLEYLLLLELETRNNKRALQLTNYAYRQIFINRYQQNKNGMK